MALNASEYAYTYIYTSKTHPTSGIYAGGEQVGAYNDDRHTFWPVRLRVTEAMSTTRGWVVGEGKKWVEERQMVVENL